jgi:hypothetical protein
MLPHFYLKDIIPFTLHHIIFNLAYIAGILWVIFVL